MMIMSIVLMCCRISISQLPDDDEGLRKWCENAWVEKDQRLEAMLAEINENKE